MRYTYLLTPHEQQEYTEEKTDRGSYWQTEQSLGSNAGLHQRHRKTQANSNNKGWS